MGSILIVFYFSFALGFWFGAWLNHKKQPWDVPLKSLLFGFIGTLFWPVILFLWSTIKSKKVN